MKDIVIKEQTVKRELFLLTVLFIVAFLMNIYAIIVHNGLWSELITQFYVVVLISLFLYVISVLMRLLIWAGRVLWSSVANKSAA